MQLRIYLKNLSKSFNFIWKKSSLPEKVFALLQKLSPSTSIFIPVLFTFRHSITSSHSFVDFSLAHALKRLSGNGKAFYHFLWHTFSSLFSVFRKISSSLRSTRAFRLEKNLNCEILWMKVSEKWWKVVKFVVCYLVKVNNVKF